MSEYHFFYKGTFSQWHPSRFVVDEIPYSHAEQFMMAEKARLFGDHETLALIMKATHPWKQKQLGQAVQGFVQPTWDAACEDIVFQGNLAKFSQNPSMLDELRETGMKILTEASPTDRIWGVGLGMGDPRLLDESQWRGKNLLGKTLMKVRKELCGE